MLAYIDPGSGSALFSILLALAAGAIYLFKSMIGKMGFSNNNVLNQASLRKSKKEMAGRMSVWDRDSVLAIFSEGANYWSTYQPIVEALLARGQAFSYYSMDIHDPGLTIENDLMQSSFIGNGARGYTRLYKIPHQILLTSTPNFDTPGYPVARPAAVERMIYIFHAVDGIPMLAKHSLDAFDAVYLSGEYQEEAIRELEQKRGLKEKAFRCVGLPYLDFFAAEKIALEESLSNLQTSDEHSSEKQAIRTILVGASWGAKSCLAHYGTDFIWALAKAGYRVILRPHPQSYISEKDLMLQLKKDAKKYPNVIFDAERSPIKSMQEADLMISDTSSIRFDYAFLYEKPVITLSIPDTDLTRYEAGDLEKSTNELTGQSEQLGHTVCEVDLTELPELVERTIKEYSPDLIQQMRDRHIVHFTQAGHAIADALIADSEELIYEQAMSFMPPGFVDEMNLKIQDLRLELNALKEEVYRNKASM